MDDKLLMLEKARIMSVLAQRNIELLVHDLAVLILAKREAPVGGGGGEPLQTEKVP
jgi:hypothetical protein